MIIPSSPVAGEAGTAQAGGGSPTWPLSNKKGAHLHAALLPTPAEAHDGMPDCSVWHCQAVQPQ